MSSRKPGCPRFSNSNSAYRRLSSGTVGSFAVVGPRNRCQRDARNMPKTRFGAPRRTDDPRPPSPGIPMAACCALAVHKQPRLPAETDRRHRQNPERARQTQRDQPAARASATSAGRTRIRPCQRTQWPAAARINVDHLNEKAERIGDEAGCQDEQRSGENGDGRKDKQSRPTEVPDATGTSGRAAAGAIRRRLPTSWRPHRWPRRAHTRRPRPGRRQRQPSRRLRRAHASTPAW